jgi:hypothetical protein
VSTISPFPRKESILPDVRVTQVENFITHNGHFDFYQINGSTYNLKIVQKWLSIVTGTLTPAIASDCRRAAWMKI